VQSRWIGSSQDDAFLAEGADITPQSLLPTS